eukprot:scaffold27876_cov58-Phaeocystis_antarctica.AAC.4
MRIQCHVAHVAASRQYTASPPPSQSAASPPPSQTYGGASDSAHHRSQRRATNGMHVTVKPSRTGPVHVTRRSDRARGEHGVSGSTGRWVLSSNGGQSQLVATAPAVGSI